jgi:hypothetical protein
MVSLLRDPDGGDLRSGRERSTGLNYTPQSPAGMLRWPDVQRSFPVYRRRTLYAQLWLMRSDEAKSSIEFAFLGPPLTVRARLKESDTIGLRNGSCSRLGVSTRSIDDAGQMNDGGRCDSFPSIRA